MSTAARGAQQQFYGNTYPRCPLLNPRFQQSIAAVSAPLDPAGAGKRPAIPGVTLYHAQATMLCTRLRSR
jgi:hypothetical protein